MLVDRKTCLSPNVAMHIVKNIFEAKKMVFKIHFQESDSEPIFFVATRNKRNFHSTKSSL